MKPGRNEMLLIATLMVWIIAYAAWTADWTFGEMPYRLERALRRIPVCLFGAACCWAMKVLLDRTESKAWPARLSIALAACVGASAAQAAANTMVFYVISPKWGATNATEILQLAMVVAWVFFAWTALYFAIDAYGRSEEARVRAAAAETSVVRARHQLLSQQLAPHFLFNALNTLSGLVMEGEKERSEKIITALSALLRQSLQSERRQFVALGDELDLVTRYLTIEETRFEDRLATRISIERGLEKLSIPAMILQPLVENAIKHGVARSLGPVEVSISAEQQQGRLCITISDDACPRAGLPPAEGNGLGERNVRERLSLLFGESASLHCRHLPDRGYEARLMMPATSHESA